MQVDSPNVSVIMPVRNEARFIGECLQQLTSQTYPKNRYEVIVIDGMSEDATRDIVRRYASAGREKSGPAIRLVDNPRKSIYPALNVGIKEAKGQIVMRVDGRCVCPLNYIEKCVQTLEQTHADNVGGMQVPLGKSIVQRAIALAMSHPFGVGNARYRVGRKSGYADTVYLGCFRREIFDRIGGFDEQSLLIGEDSDVNERIRNTGGEVYLNCDIKVGYYPRDTIKQHCKIYFIWGKARASFFRKHGKLTSWRQLVPPAFIVVMTLLLISALFSSVGRLLFSIAMFSYFLCDLLVAGYLTIRERNFNLFPLLLVVFPCMHFSWGFGFLVGLTGRLGKKNYWR